MLTRYGYPIKLFHGTCSEFEVFWPLSHFGTRLAVQKVLRIPRIKFDLFAVLNAAAVKQEWERLSREQTPQPKVIPVHLQIRNPATLVDPDFHSLKGYKDLVLQWMMKREFKTNADLDVYVRRAMRHMPNSEFFPMYEHFCKRAHFMKQFRFMFEQPFELSSEAVKHELSLGGLFALTETAAHGLSAEQINRSHLVAQRMIRFFESLGYDGFQYVNEFENKGQMSYINFRPEQVIRLDRGKMVPQSHKTPENEALLDNIWQAALAQMPEKPMTSEECAHFSRAEFFFKRNKKMQFNPLLYRTVWIDWAFHNILPRVRRRLSLNARLKVEQAVLLGIEYALLYKMRPNAVILGCALHRCRNVGFIWDVVNANRWNDRCFYDTTRLHQILTAIDKQSAGEKGSNGVESCVWDAIRTVEAWEKGSADGLVFSTEYARRLATCSPEERRKYLQHQTALLNRHPEWGSVLCTRARIARNRVDKAVEGFVRIKQ